MVAFDIYVLDVTSTLAMHPTSLLPPNTRMFSDPLVLGSTQKSLVSLFYPLTVKLGTAVRIAEECEVTIGKSYW
jgi:hypothetical protein